MATSRRSSYLHHPAVAARDKEWHGRTHEDPNATANPSRQEGFQASRKFRSRLPSIPASAPLRPLPSPSSSIDLGDPTGDSDCIHSSARLDRDIIRWNEGLRLMKVSARGSPEE